MTGVAIDWPRNDCNFSNGEQNELEDVTKNTELEIVQPTKNHPSELWHIKIELETSWEPIWDLIENKKIWYHEIVVTSPHVIKSEIHQF
jgi:hypothetical protein